MASLSIDIDGDRPIGVFDSGFGGLTVADALHRRLPHEALLYFGDTARVPYGSKAPETVRRFAREAAKFLLSRDIKLLVIASNTATAHAERVLREELDIPVVGVIQPGAAAAVAATRNGRIGVVGTAGTIASGAYDLAVRRRLGENGRVYAQPCPLFVPLVEEGWTEHPVAAAITAEYLAPLKEVDVDVIVLGCTHYPLLRPVLQTVAGDAVTLVDSGEETAIQVERILESEGLTRRSNEPPAHAFFVSDSPHRFRDAARRFVGDLIDGVHHVDIDGFGHHVYQLENGR